MYHTKQKNSDIYDFIFIHTPKFNHYLHPLNKVGFVNIIGTGLFAMADLLSRNNFNVKILHLGIERLEDKNYNIKDLIKVFPSKIYGISLQWHFQSYDAIELAKAIKEIFPRSYLLLGGLTASFFAEEILQNFDFIDGIIKGEGEIPVLMLTKHIVNNEGLTSEIPNLIYRENNEIKQTNRVFISDDKFLSSLNFSNMSLLNNYKTYNKLFLFAKYDRPIINKSFSFINFLLSPSIYLTIGRGCPFNCSFCAGGYNLRKILQRQYVGLRSIDSIMSDIDRLLSYGFNHFVSGHYYFKFEDYYLSLIEEISKLKQHIKLNFEVWGLPSKNLIEALSILKNNVHLMILGYSFSEKVRDKNNIHNYTNRELMEILKLCRQKKIYTKFILSSGLPFEDAQEVVNINKFIQQVNKVHPGTLSFSIPTEITPGSPMYFDPQKYSIIKTVNSFIDYYNIHKSQKYIMGYHFHNMDEKEMLKAKCKTQCFIHPKYGRYICGLLHRLTK